MGGTLFMRTPEEQASYIEHLEAQVRELKVEIDRLKKEKGISGPREGLTFNSHTGLWADAGGQLYCPKCLDGDKRNPLKIESHGWRCTAGAHYFSNPDSPHPVVRTRGGPLSA